MEEVEVLRREISDHKLNLSDQKSQLMMCKSALAASRDEFEASNARETELQRQLEILREKFESEKLELSL